MKFNNGLILQWATSVAYNTVANYPISFENKCIGWVSGIAFSGNPASVISLYIQRYDLSTFVYQYQGGLTGMTWIFLGC